MLYLSAPVVRRAFSNVHRWRPGSFHRGLGSGFSVDYDCVAIPPMVLAAAETLRNRESIVMVKFVLLCGAFFVQLNDPYCSSLELLLVHRPGLRGARIADVYLEQDLGA